MYHVYILQCEDGSLYTGITTDLKRRLQEHKKGEGGSYTRSRGAARIVYSERAETRSAALIREAGIKRLSRRQKQTLVGKGGIVSAPGIGYTRAMAKRPDVDIRRKKSHSRKTAKRLAVKAAMLSARKAKKHR